MKFKELMSLEYCERTGKIPIDILIANNINAPSEVLEEVYSSHGRKDDFQFQYGEIELNDIKWQRISINGLEIIKCEYFQRFGNWIESVEARLKAWDEKSWDCIDTRKNIVLHWQNEKTWLTSPFFINSSLIQNTNNLHLVEGHTRLGILKGLITRNIIPADSKHLIWHGDN